MEPTTRTIGRFLGLTLAFGGLYALVDATLLLIVPERLPTGQLTDQSILLLMAREAAVGCAALAAGALVLHRTREEENAEGESRPNAAV